MLVILFRPFVFFALKTLNYLAFQSFDFNPDEGYYRNASCTLTLLCFYYKLKSVWEDRILLL